jgi:hypothetical protein
VTQSSCERYLLAVTDSPVHTRFELQRVATHILARARFFSDGHLGLRVSASGLITPAFGPDDEVLRLTPERLVRERRRGDIAVSEMIGLLDTSLQALAAFADVDLDEHFDAGRDACTVGDPDRPVGLERSPTAAILSWFRSGAEILDDVATHFDETSVMQLWPEHFDLAFDALTRSGRVTFGASPGDGDHDEPYLYVGPGDGVRPGDAAFWNASFGALRAQSALVEDPLAQGRAFFENALCLLD